MTIRQWLKPDYKPDSAIHPLTWLMQTLLHSGIVNSSIAYSLQSIHVLFLFEILNLKYDLGIYCWRDFALSCLIQMTVFKRLKIKRTKCTTFDVR